MCSLVMSLFSRDYIKTEIDQLKYQQCFNLLTSVQYSHSDWFLGGRASILAFGYIPSEQNPADFTTGLLKLLV